MQVSTKSLSAAQILICGAAIVTLSMGIRHGFGLWLQPITQAQDWSRETYSLAIALKTSLGVSSVSSRVWWPIGLAHSE